METSVFVTSFHGYLIDEELLLQQLQSLLEEYFEETSLLSQENAFTAEVFVAGVQVVLRVLLITFVFTSDARQSKEAAHLALETFLNILNELTSNPKTTMTIPDIYQYVYTKCLGNIVYSNEHTDLLFLRRIEHLISTLLWFSHPTFSTRDRLHLCRFHLKHVLQTQLLHSSSYLPFLEWLEAFQESFAKCCSLSCYETILKTLSHPLDKELLEEEASQLRLRRYQDTATELEEYCAAGLLASR
jgi:hypothetical protein